MTEKVASKYLLNLEKQFAHDDPVLLNALKIFQELDRIEYDLGLIGADETTASKYSWWPIISLIGGNSAVKTKFINSYLGSGQTANIQTSGHKFTVLLHSNQPNAATLLGSALDADPRYPFYQIAGKIERQQSGEGHRINAYLELKTIRNELLKGKLFIDTPNVMTTLATPVISLLTQHTIENSDLVLVFTDALEQESPIRPELIRLITEYQDSNKFVYLIDESAMNLSTSNSQAIISLWQRKLSELGINTGQFIVPPNPQNMLSQPAAHPFAELDLRFANIEHDRSYRIVESLEKSVAALENVVVPEVKKGIGIWKERSHLALVAMLSVIAAIAIFLELEMGILEFLLDPVIGPIAIGVLLVVVVPAHLLFSRLLAKAVIQQLNARQKELFIMENLADMFEYNLTFSRMLWPISDPNGWNKKIRTRLLNLTDKAKELIQTLNDRFSDLDQSRPTGVE